MPENTTTTTATEKILDAVRANPGSTSVEVAEAAGVGRSTASKALAALAQAGHVTRTKDDADAEGVKAAFRWHLAPPSDHKDAPSTDPVQADPVTPPPGTEDEAPTTAEANTNDDDQATSGGKRRRLKAGELRGQIEQYLSEHPDDEYTPTALGHLLGRSSGAIANALEKLVADNYAILVKPKPRTYRSAPQD